MPVIVCTSATMTFQKSFELWKQKNGVSSEFPIKETIIESPFPYKENVLCVIPSDAPIPSGREEAQYIEYLYTHLADILDISKGRALILCTSYSMVDNIAGMLKKVESQHEWDVLVQDGSDSIATLSEKFRMSEHSVLVGTASFWEGFDAPGDTLKLLIITKLPFPHPQNLFVKEESMALKSQGLSDFGEIMLPEAELKLRQGFGRLMRSDSDSGVVLILDKRLEVAGYGSQLMSMLPRCNYVFDTMPRIKKEITSFLELTS